MSSYFDLKPMININPEEAKTRATTLNDTAEVKASVIKRSMSSPPPSSLESR